MKSNHLLINAWLSSGTKLTEEQEEMIKAHKSTCEICRQQETTNEQVSHFFRSAGQISPASGFSSRWQKRLALQRLRDQRKKSWIFFGVTGSLAFTAMVLLALQVVTLLRSPAQILVALVYLFTSITTSVNSIGEYLKVFDIVIPSVSLIGLMFFAGFISLLGVLWVVMFQKLSSIRRMV